MDVVGNGERRELQRLKRGRGTKEAGIAGCTYREGRMRKKNTERRVEAYNKRERVS